MHSRARTDTRCAALPAALMTTTSRTRFAAFRLSASTPWTEPPVRRGRGRQRRSSSAARLGMPTSKWKRSGCALRIVCAAAVPGCVLHQDSFVRLLPAYPVSRPAAVFASPGLSGCPPSGWAARGALQTPLGRPRRCAAALSSAILSWAGTGAGSARLSSFGSEGVLQAPSLFKVYPRRYARIVSCAQLVLC